MTHLSESPRRFDLQSLSAGVTIIIPAYNAERTIARAVRSALDQGPDVKAVIIVLDGPSEATEAAATQSGDCRIVMLVNAQRRGGSFSRNRGLGQATTEHVLFLDADDYLEGGLVVGLLVQAQCDDAAIVFGPWRSMESESGRTSAPFYPDFINAADLVTRWLAHREYVPPCSVLWRQSFLRQIGGWDEELVRNQDGELVLRAILLGATFQCSARGMGIWVRYPQKLSVSSRLDTAVHMLDAPLKLLKLQSETVGRDVLRKACAQHLYASASFCFANANFPAGRAALKESRRLGFYRHRGDKKLKGLAYLVGLERAYRIKRTVTSLGLYIGRGT